MGKVINIIFIVVVAGAGFVYRDPIKNIWAQSFNHYFPCKTAITYSVGSFDNKFGLSKDDFLKAISSAEGIWEKPISKNLFKYTSGGDMKINLIYDTRQEVTINLKNMGIVAQNNKASYGALKEKYDSTKTYYEQQKISFQSAVSAFEIRKNVFEEEVSRVNSRGGANKQTYARLNVQRELINQEIEKINKLQNDLNATVDNINALATALNQLATLLNIDVKKFNTIGASLGGEFEEGTYESSSTGQNINIYQFDDKTKLVRVLAHELGHALGLDHNEDSKAIMYRLNNGVNEKLTNTDLAELKKLCGIK